MSAKPFPHADAEAWPQLKVYRADPDRPEDALAFVVPRHSRVVPPAKRSPEPTRGQVAYALGLPPYAL